MVGIHFACRDQEASWFLQNPPSWFSFSSALSIFRINIQAETGAERDGADDWMVGSAVLVWHNALAWFVFVYEDVVWGVVGGGGEDVVGWVVGGNWYREDARYGGLNEPLGKRSCE